jgi:glycosyltransferase involved in cell wall biosynthesis
VADPRVTVGIATYNGAKYLPEQLDTVFAQTHGNIDVVAVDDGSTDGTVELLEGFARRHPVRVLRNPKNLGLVGNFERVLRECYAGGAPFVALADQDDIWRPAKIETLLRHIGDASLIFNPAEWVLHTDGSLGRPASFHAYMAYCARRGTGRRVPELLANNFVVGHQVVLRREIIPAALPFPPGLRYHDHWVAVTAARVGGIRFHPADLMVYRQHPESLTFARAVGGRPLGARLGGWFARHRDHLNEARLQVDRLARWEHLAGFAPADREFMRRLRAVYQAQLTPGPHPAGALAAARLDRFFFFPGQATRVRYYLSALLGTLLAPPPDDSYL